MDYVIDTVAAPHDIDPLLALLKVNGKMVMVGIPEKPFSLLPSTLVFGTFYGSISFNNRVILHR